MDHIQSYAHQETTQTDLKLIFGTLSVVVSKTTVTLISPIESIIRHELFDCVDDQTHPLLAVNNESDVSVECHVQMAIQWSHPRANVNVLCNVHCVEERAQHT